MVAGYAREITRRGKAATLTASDRAKNKNAGIGGRRSRIENARRNGASPGRVYWRYCWMRVVRNPAKPC